MSVDLRHSLRVKLFLSYLLVIAVGVLTLSGITLLIAPNVHERLMGSMMGSTTMPMSGSMMDQMERNLALAFQASVFQALLLAAGVASFAAVVVSLFVSSRIVQPVRQLLAASQRIAAGHYAERVPPGADDELGALAEQFNTMAAELEAAERRRVALIGNVAHELRTPLATIEGYTEGLLDGVVEPDIETWAALHDEVGRLRRLIHDLQELSRAEARQIPLHLQPAPPAQLVAQALAVMGAQFADKDIALTSSVAQHLPAVQADPDRIVQVLINLLGNALRATPAGGSVELQAEQRDQTVAFHVRDTGIGIASEHLPHLFERFYRVDPARSRALGGTGIGLTISKALVEAHHGRIWADSAGAGHGATFSFTLPTA